MELSVSVLLVEWDEPSPHATMRIVPQKMGFGWGYEAPRMEVDRETPSLYLNCSTTTYQTSVDQYHNAGLDITSHYSSDVNELRKRVEFEAKYQEEYRNHETYGLENPQHALVAYVVALNLAKDSFVHQNNSGTFGVMTLNDVVSEYRRMATNSMAQAVRKLIDDKYAEWAKRKQEEIEGIHESYSNIIKTTG